MYNVAFMGETVFGSSLDENPILATDGLRSCIGFAGWEPEKKISSSFISGVLPK